MHIDAKYIHQQENQTFSTFTIQCYKYSNLKSDKRRVVKYKVNKRKLKLIDWDFLGQPTHQLAFTPLGHAAS